MRLFLMISANSLCQKAPYLLNNQQAWGSVLVVVRTTRMGLPSHCFFKGFKIPFWKKPTTADHYKDPNPDVACYITCNNIASVYCCRPGRSTRMPVVVRPPSPNLKASESEHGGGSTRAPEWLLRDWDDYYLPEDAGGAGGGGRKYKKHLTGDRIRILLPTLPFVLRDLIAPEVNLLYAVSHDMLHKICNILHNMLHNMHT
jgi:hypothetical protein